MGILCPLIVNGERLENLNTDKIVRLKYFANSVSIPLSNTDGIKWPIRAGEVITPVNHIFASEYVRQIFQLRNDYSSNEWHNAFNNSLSLWRYSHHVINGLEKAGVEKSTISEFVATIMEIVEVLTKRTDFFEGKHLVLNNSAVDSILGLPFIRDKQTNLMLLRLAGLLWAYSDALYFQGREVCCEYHGPYSFGKNGDTLLVRDFCNLCPDDLWTEYGFDKSIHRIRIITQHNCTLETYIDVYNNVNIKKGSMAESIIGGVIIVDDNIANSHVINLLISNFLEKLKNQTILVNGMDKNELFSKYLMIFWYRKKALASFLGEKWTPPPSVFDIMKDTEIDHHIENPYKDVPIERLKKKFDYSVCS